MKRGWKILFFLVAVCSVVAAAFMFAPQDDELNFIRKYGGSESIRRIRSNARMDIYFHSFTFKRLPPKLLKEIDAWKNANFYYLPIRRLSRSGIYSIDTKDHTQTLSGGYVVGECKVEVNRVTQFNWLERQWKSLQVTLGFMEPPRGQIEVIPSPPSLGSDQETARQ